MKCRVYQVAEFANRATIKCDDVVEVQLLNNPNGCNLYRGRVIGIKDTSIIIDTSSQYSATTETFHYNRIADIRVVTE